MGEYDVTWQMTGTTRVTATDDLDAKTQVDALRPHERLVAASVIQEARVIATREVEPKK